MVQKSQVSRGGKAAGGKRRPTGAIGKPNTSMIGKSTARKMQEKLQQHKSRKADDDDEVKSSDSHGTFEGEDNERAIKSREALQKKNGLLLDDPFLVDGNVMDAPEETIEERRLRMTKQVINEYASASKDDFFESLYSKTRADY